MSSLLTYLATPKQCHKCEDNICPFIWCKQGNVGTSFSYDSISQLDPDTEQVNSSDSVSVPPEMNVLLKASGQRFSIFSTNQPFFNLIARCGIQKTFILEKKNVYSKVRLWPDITAQSFPPPKTQSFLPLAVISENDCFWDGNYWELVRYLDELILWEMVIFHARLFKLITFSKISSE